MKPSSTRTAAPPSLPPALISRIETALKALYPDAMKVVVRVDKTTGQGSKRHPLEVIIRADLPPQSPWMSGGSINVSGGTLNRWSFASIEEASANVPERFSQWISERASESIKSAERLRTQAQETLRQAEREDVRARDVREVLAVFTLSGVSAGEIGR